MLKKFFGQKNVNLQDIVAVMVLLAVLILSFHSDADPVSVFTMREQVTAGYLAAATDASSLVYIDNGKGRVVGIKDNRVAFSIASGSANGAFYQAEDLTIDSGDGSFYVLSVDWDASGYLLESERVLKYSPEGKYLGVVYEEDYVPEDEINRHRLFDIRVTDGNLSLIRADDTGITLLTTAEGEAGPERFFAFEDAWLYFQNFAHDAEGTVVAVDKRGVLYRFADGEAEEVYRSPENSREVLFDSDFDGEGNLLCVDIYNGRIFRVLPEGGTQDLFTAEGTAAAQISSVQCNNAVLSTICNDSVVLATPDGGVLLSESGFHKGITFYVGVLSSIIIGLLLVICLIYLVLRVVFYFVFNRPKWSFVTAAEVFLVVFTAALTVSVVFGLSLPFQTIYLGSTTGQLKDMAIAGANRFEPEWLKGIQGADDFMNEDYAEMSALLDSITTRFHDTDSRYGAEVDIIDEDGRAYALCYTDNSIGTYYPLDEWTKEEIQRIYDSGIPTESEPTLSAGGTFLFGRAPIFDQGKVVGVFAVARDNYRVMQTFRDIIRNIIISVVLGVIAVIFLINEGFELIPQLKKEKTNENRATIGAQGVSLPSLRIMAFTIAFVLNMTSSFLSVYTSGFWYEGLGIPKSLAGAVPLFANAIFVAVSSLFCPRLMRSLGFRKLTVTGLFLSAAGDCLAGLSTGYIAIVLALFLNGVGFGILMNTISITIGTVDQPEERQRGFAGYNAGYIAGTNSGMIFGSFVAGALSHPQVFFVTTALWLAQVLLFARAGKSIPSVSVTQQELEEQRAAVRRYFPAKGVLYLLTISVPFAVMGSFQYYYIPILSESLGYNEKYASLLMLVFAVCGILLGKSLTELMWSRLKHAAVYPAFALALAAWLIISWSSDLRITCVTMVILGVAFSFGLNVLVEVFLEMDNVDKIGEDTAMSVYNFGTGLGQSFSSIICGMILAAGMLRGMCVFAGVCVVFLVLYRVVITGKPEKEVREKN